jgi:hypothetical protein
MYYKNRPVTDLAEPMESVFVGDSALYLNQKEGRFLRCSVYEVLKSGEVMIYCLDEGIQMATEPSNLYRMPWKLRQFEPLALTLSMRQANNEELKEEEVSYAKL